MKDCSQSQIDLCIGHPFCPISVPCLLFGKKIKSIMAEMSTYNRAIGRSESRGRGGPVEMWLTYAAPAWFR